ncbi:MAG: DUF4252 domain-containing protein [Bacteroidetes bacterium]|jgi:hypothetical protein|nr:DUF4252 domain-containing protein [Bacteroidota bacterium]MBT3749134.1 DUF4252 domain-containing protein [Bacteroidota bacterium]MBT4401637.1 DUF4252 domain-containing protein [Bacteroidota bacterium]MBT4410696.1 DUF4252 domain-containing protein [Bacteroidota bacterium]MBT5427649.1 DUF4252 domain-containing protein [Bacteroidota bacterium]
MISRILLAVLFTLGLMFSACESQKKVSEIVYDKYNDQDGFSMVVLPPSFVDNFVDDENEDQIDFLKTLRDFRLMSFDDEIGENSNKSVFRDINKLLDKRGFEEYFSINKNGSMVTVRGIQKKNVIKEMHVIVKGEEKIFLASLTGRIDINKMKSTMDDIDFDDFSGLENISGEFDFEDFNFDF